MVDLGVDDAIIYGQYLRAIIVRWLAALAKI